MHAKRQSKSPLIITCLVIMWTPLYLVPIKLLLMMCIQEHHTYLYLYNTNSVCVCVCLSSIGGQTAGPIMTKFGTHMRIDLGMVPTKYWPHEWPGSVGSLGPISESGLSCQLLLRAVVWQMTSQ